MQKLGWLIIICVMTLGLFGYHRAQHEPLTFTTPQGYAAAMPIPKTSWKDSLTGALNPIDESADKVLILEMAPVAKAEATKTKEVAHPKALKPAKASKPLLKANRRQRTAKLLPKRSRIH